jgi:A/G-specific adenine glycosylase
MTDIVFVSQMAGIVQPLLRWFRKTKRDLPWRRTYNPYHVWISEIMLQQTQMDRGVAYFLRWIERFPCVHDVAEAEEQEILKYWEGLGYYARARNLHKAAKLLVNEFDGQVPCDYTLLLTLPGVGPYTAAAIASVAGNNDVAVVDANVIRVYARLFDIAESTKDRLVQKRIVKIAETLLPQGKARAYNQALMDFGGLICTPKNPHCQICPIYSSCGAFKAGTTGKRPVAGRPKKIVSLQKVAGIVCWEGRAFIQQRKADDVWGGLWEFPGGELSKGKPGEMLAGKIFENTGLSVAVLKPVTTVVHQYTHHKITLHCFLCALKGRKHKPVLQSACNYRWVYPREFEEFGFPAGPRKILEYIKKSNPDFFV